MPTFSSFLYYYYYYFQRWCKSSATRTESRIWPSLRPYKYGRSYQIARGCKAWCSINTGDSRIRRSNFFFTRTPRRRMFGRIREHSREPKTRKKNVQQFYLQTRSVLCQFYNTWRCTSWAHHGAGSRSYTTDLGQLRTKFIISWYLFSQACVL
jgi:hypothetical protein